MTDDRPCPSVDALLQAFYGLLPPDVEGAHLAHMNSCAACHANVIRALGPVFAWRRLMFFVRRMLHSLFERRPDGRRISTATALIPVFIVIFLLITTHSIIIDADKLMQRALLAERLHLLAPSSSVRLVFRPNGGADPFTTVRYLGPARTTGGSATTAVPAAAARALGASHVELDRPLSLEYVTAWSLLHAATRQDSVVSYPKSGLIVMTMAVPDDDLRQVALTLEAETLSVVREELTLREIGRVEMESLTHSAPMRTTPAYTGSRIASPSAVPAASLAPRSGKLDELNARLRLVKTGADMRNAARAIAPMPVPRYALADLLNRKFADPDTRATFLTRLAGSLGIVRRRLTLLSDLGQRYPQAAGLSERERQVLRRLVGLEYRQLCPELDELRRKMFALTAADDVVHASKHPPTDLIDRAPGAFSRASSLEREMQRLLTHKDITEAEEHTIRGALVDLWEAVHGQRPRDTARR